MLKQMLIKNIGIPTFLYELITIAFMMHTDRIYAGGYQIASVHQLKIQGSKYLGMKLIVKAYVAR